jgi:hypothetical protein
MHRRSMGQGAGLAATPMWAWAVTSRAAIYESSARMFGAGMIDVRVLQADATAAWDLREKGMRPGWRRKPAATARAAGVLSQSMRTLQGVGAASHMATAVCARPLYRVRAPMVRPPAMRRAAGSAPEFPQIIGWRHATSRRARASHGGRWRAAHAPACTHGAKGAAS